MHWQALLADLEAEFDGALAADFHGEVADRSRRQAARLQLTDRLGAVLGSRLTVRVAGVGPVSGVLESVGPDWLLLAEPPTREWLVAGAAVLTVSGLSARSTAPESRTRVGARLDLGYALRAVARSRSEVVVVLVDGATVHGTIDRVGHDFVEVTDRRAGDGPAAGARVHAVRHSGIALVRTG